MELNLYSPDGKLNLYKPDGYRFDTIREFITYYSGDEYKRLTKDDYSIAEGLADKLLNADAFDRDNGREEAFFILAWKIDGINYSRTNENATDKQKTALKKISYKSNWIWDKQNPQAKQYGNSIAPLVGEKGLLDKIVELGEQKRFWEDKKFADCNTREQAKEIIRQLVELGTQRMGAVYLLTLLYFLTNGRWPIYDQFAYLSMVAIQKGGVPNKDSYKYYPDHMPNKQDGDATFLEEMLKTVYGKDRYHQYGDLVEFVEEFQDAYLEEAEKLPDKAKNLKYKIYIESRDIDRALWAYGHYFKEKKTKLVSSKRKSAVKKYEALTAEWYDLLETLRCSKLDLKAVKHLIFDTYHFLKSYLTGDSVPRNQLELYKYIGQVCQSLYTDYPIGMKHSETLVFLAFASGLCLVYENGFVGYGENSLRLIFIDEPSGFYEPEADMTTYESFEKDFNKFVGWYQEYDDEDADE